MADKMRVRKAVSVEHYPVASADIIEVGDIVWFNGTSNAIEPGADHTWATSTAAS